MPALLAAPGVARFSVQSSYGGRAMENIFHTVKQEAVSAYTVAELTALATAFGTWYTGQILPLVSDGVTYQGTIGLDLGSDSGLEAAVTGSGTGSSIGSSLPANVAACISWTQGVHYRGGHPRTYIGGATSSWMNGVTQLSSSFMSSLLAAGNSLITAIGAVSGISDGPAALVCLHRTRGKVQLNPPQAGIVFSAIVHSRIDSQRRRLGKETL